MIQVLRRGSSFYTKMTHASTTAQILMLPCFSRLPFAASLNHAFFRRRQTRAAISQFFIHLLRKKNTCALPIKTHALKLSGVGNSDKSFRRKMYNGGVDVDVFACMMLYSFLRWIQ